MNSYKNRSDILRRDDPQVPDAPEVPEMPEPNVKHYALLDDPGRQPRRRSRATITVAMVVVGLLAGWLGGISLTGAFQRSKRAADVPINSNAAPAPQLQPDTRPSSNVDPGGKSGRPRD